MSYADPIRWEQTGERMRYYPVHLVHIVQLGRTGKPPEGSEQVYQSDARVFAPGISPFAIVRVDVDPVDYTSRAGLREARVTYRENEGNPELVPETEHFTTLDEFLSFETA